MKRPRTGAFALVALASACGPERVREVPSGPARAESARASEAIAVRLGEREVRVHCALACEPARAELERLRKACTRDPLATPRRILVQGSPLTELGCCTESEHAYREACGVEALSACVSRWSAECWAASLARGESASGAVGIAP